jgi:omega-6 fatty acid desaturase (delta-12 desaturase)
MPAMGSASVNGYSRWPSIGTAVVGLAARRTRKGGAVAPTETGVDARSGQPETPHLALRQDGSPAKLREQRATWREALAPYTRPSRPLALLDIATSVLPYLALSVAMYLALRLSYVLMLVLALPAALCLVRTFILFHDCTHGSFFSSKRANAWLGRVLGLLLYSPFLRWRHDHAVHHATSGDLGRRGVGDVRTLTVREYGALTWRGRLAYRLQRNPLVMFGLGPIVAMVIGPRIAARGARPRMRRSVLATNFALAMTVGTLCWLIGWRQFLFISAPPELLAGSMGIWLFYVQHQFEDAYWENAAAWGYEDAALRGSSYLKLPGVLRFFTGNIGYHHVHHLNARIPNYNLRRAHDENPIFHNVPTLSLWDGLRAVRLKLWDEDHKRLVTYAQARRGDPAMRTAAIGAGGAVR